MAQFITTTFSGGNDIALQLGQEEWVRTLAIGSSWNYIRIGVLVQMTGTATTSGTSFAIGMCAGTALPFGNASCQNFVGVNFPGNFGYFANAPYPYWGLGNTNAFACKKLGSSITSAATNLPDSIGMSFQTAGGTARRGILFVDIIKGSPNYTIGLMASSTAYANVDFTVANLLYGMTQPFANNWTCGGGQIYYGNNAQTLACDETAGGFDTVDIYCNCLNNPFNIYEIAVEKLA
jgi:hypothetical protein